MQCLFGPKTEKLWGPKKKKNLKIHEGVLEDIRRTKLIFSLILFFARIQTLWEQISSLHPSSEQTFETVSYTKLET